jgi:neurofibromin 1
MCAESKMVDEEIESQQSIMTFSHNIEIYEDLSYEEPIVQGLRKQPFVGRKAQQKRIRKYLRMMTSPTPGILNAWEEVWRRWKILTQVVSRFGMDSLRDPYEQLQHQQQLQQQQQQQINSPVKKIGGLVRHERLRNSTVKAAPVPVARIETDDEKQTEWQNYTGFLAALGGSRLMNDLDDDMSDDGKRRGASDRMSISSATSSMSNPFSLADRFVREMVELLTSENVIIRESVKETLGSNLSPALYPVLFRHLESAMSSCFNINGEVFREANNTLFVEQAVLVLKMILDRLTDPSDCLLSVDFSTLVLKFANYINKLPHDNYTAMRIMIMMCHLTEALMSRKEQVIVRDDVRVRNKLLEIIVEWTSDFTLVSSLFFFVLKNRNTYIDCQI